MSHPGESFSGVDSMVAPLRRVAMRRPAAILTADPKQWHYAKAIDAIGLVRQYDRFVDLVVAAGAEVIWLSDEDDELADSIFTFDPSFVLPTGAVLLRPGKEGRRGEVALHEELYRREHIPILGRIEPPGVVEGGDLLWVDGETIAAGLGPRTDESGVEQFRAITARLGIDVVNFDLPDHPDPDACMHLLSLVNPLDDDLFLVHRPLVPDALLELLHERGIAALEAPAAEFAASGGLSLNVLATAPRRAIAIAGFPDTAAILRDAGCVVETFAADELCLPCEGGPTCLTRPILRLR